MKTKILFLDDNERFLHLLKMIFEENNAAFKGFYANNFEEADNLAKKHNFLCFVLDIQLKNQKLSGIDIARIFRKRYPESAIILLTNHPAEQYKEKYLFIDDCIDKNTDVDLLEKTIFNIIRMRKIKLSRNLLPCEKEIKFVSRINTKEGAERLEGILTKDNQRIVWVVYNLPEIYHRKNVIGLSSSVGCVGGCKFCLSGKRPFVRPLSTREILGQISHGLYSYHASGFFYGLKKLVINFTCEGDAVFSNLDNSCAAIRRLSTSGIGLSPFIITTIGNQKNLSRFLREYGDLPINFYWSLNFLDEKKRAEFMPGTKGQSLGKLRDTFHEIAKKNRRIITISWVLMKGINDKEEDALALKDFLGNGPFEVKLMPLEPNSLPGVETSQSDMERFTGWLQKLRIPFRKRFIVGGRIMAGCGTTVPIDIPD